MAIERADGKAGLRPAWTVCLLVALAPAIMALTTWTPDGHFSMPLYFWRFLAPPVIAIELAAIAIAWASGYRPLAAILSLPGWIAAAIGLLVAIDVGDALLVAPDRATALMRGAVTFTHLLFGLAVLHLLRARGFDAYRALWWALLGGAVLYVAILIAFVTAIAQPLRFDWLHFGLGVVNIRHVGFYAMVGSALALGIAATESRPGRYWLAVVAAALCCAEFFWSGSRAPIAVLCISCIAGMVLVPALRTPRLPLALAIANAGGAAISLLHTPPLGNYGIARMLATGGAATMDGVASGRIELWRGSIHTMLARPFGYGEGQFIRVVPEAQEILHHPHNVLLQALVQWGMVGAALLTVLAAVLWWRVFRGVRDSGIQAAPPFLAINAFLLYAMVDGIFFFVYPAMILTFLFAAGLAATGAPSNGTDATLNPASA